MSRAKELIDYLNKSRGKKIAYNLDEENPATVKDWIPTGSRWLDSIIARKMMGGIPVGRVIQVLGEESSGKSFLAMQVAINAVKKGIDVIYFDTEAAVNKSFATSMGINPQDFVYIPIDYLEQCFEIIEDLCKLNDNSKLFVLDSIALTPCKVEYEGNFDPQSNMSPKSKVAALGYKKLTMPLAKSNSAFLIVNQLHSNFDPRTNKYRPLNPDGGKKIRYANSLSIWLTRPNGQKDFIYQVGDKLYTGAELVSKNIDKKQSKRVGAKIDVRIDKSRFGSEDRKCELKILWGADEPCIMDEESWKEAICDSQYVTKGSWWKLKYEDGTEEKFRSSDWMEKIKEEKFRKRVLQIMDEILIDNEGGLFETKQVEDDEEESIEQSTEEL